MFWLHTVEINDSVCTCFTERKGGAIERDRAAESERFDKWAKVTGEYYMESSVQVELCL